MLNVKDARIVVTRAKDQAGSMTRALESRGAKVLAFPTIQIVPVNDPGFNGPIDNFNWIVFTSVNAVEMFASHAPQSISDAPRICAIGPGTADAAIGLFGKVDLVPETHVAESVFDALREEEGDLEGVRILLPRGSIARDVLPNALRAHGAEVTEAVVYKTIMPEKSQEEIDGLTAFGPHMVTFTSSSTVRNFCQILGKERLENLKENTRFASIGPKTTATAQELGLQISVEPKKHSADEFIEAIAGYFLSC